MENNSKQAKWFSLASIWFGGIVSVPALLIGSTLISSLKFTSSVVAGLVGFSVVVTLMSLVSIAALKKQSTAVAIASNSFGNKGGKIIVGLVVGLSTLGWFGIQSNIAGASFSKILMDIGDVTVPEWSSSVFWGAVMVTTAVFGFQFLKWLNYVAVPAIVLLITYGVYITFQAHDFQEVLVYQPESSISLFQAIGLTIGFISVAIVISPDYNRFAATKKDAVLGSIFGILPSALPLLAIGAILAITQGTYDIVSIFAALGFPFTAMTILILATWTSNVMNIYSSGLAFNTLFNLPGKMRSKTTLVVGIVGVSLASLGIINYFLNFITLLTITVTPVTGIIVSDYFISKVRREKPRNFNWKGIFSWCSGVAFMLLTESGTRYIFGIVIAALAYSLLTGTGSMVVKKLNRKVARDISKE